MDDKKREKIMAIHWKIPFKSLRAGTDYTVNIYDANFSGTAVVLKGGAQPFTTQEDDNEDMFTPIRTQSGYIRILDDGKDANGDVLSASDDWKAMVPHTGTDRPVTLTAGGNVLWRGFMQPRNFGGVLYGNPQVREFPVQCQITSLNGFDIDPDDGDIVNFGWLLYYIFSKTGTWAYFYFQGVDAISDWLQKKVTWLNFIEQDSNGNGRSKYDCYQILEDICSFFGWTVRTHGQDVWFMSADDSSVNYTFRRLQFEDLEDVSEAQAVVVSPGEFDVIDFVNTNNEEGYALGCRKVTVSADINKRDNILEIPMEQIQSLFVGKSVSHTVVGDVHTFTVNYYPTDYENNILSVNCYWDQTTIRGRFMAMQVYEGDISDLHNYSFEYFLAAFGRNVPFSEYCFKLASKYPISFRYGSITINGNIEMKGEVYDQQNQLITVNSGYIIACLHIGDNWWNGSEWVHSQASFQIPVSDNKIADNRSLNGAYVPYNGYGIPIGNLGGLVEFYCLGSHTDGAVEGESCRVKSLTFGFARQSNLASNNDLSKNVYTQTNNSKFFEEKNIDLIFASDNGNGTGYGIIMNPSGSYASFVSYTPQSGTATQEHPEQHLANRIANYYSTIRQSETVNLDSDRLGVVAPKDLCGDLYPLAISHDWRDDITTLKLIKI